MRPLEIVLLFSTFAQFGLLAMTCAGTTRWSWRVAALSLMVAAAQILAEGPRWQMGPAYGTTAVFGLLGMMRVRGRATTASGNTGSCRAVRLFAVIVGLPVIALSIALPLALPVFHVNPPTGPFAVGTLTYHWASPDRAEVFTADPGDHREVMVQVWYPTNNSKPWPRPSYMADTNAFSRAQAALHGWPDFIFAHLKYATANAVPAAALSQDRPAYPVLLFLEGLTGYRQMNTFQVEELVSQGYIVVALDQPYVAAVVVFPDGRAVAGLSKDQIDPLIQQSIRPSDTVPILNDQPFEDRIIPYLAEDVSFVLDHLKTLNNADPNGILAGGLDLSRVGVFGISIGGIIAGEACRVDPRLAACLVMDAPMPALVAQSGLRQPAMWITRDAETMRAEGWAPADIVQHQTTMGEAFAASGGDRYLVQVPGMFHANMMDAPFFSPLAAQLGITGPINPQRGHKIINAYTVGFFDRSFKERKDVFFDQLRLGYPEVHLDYRTASATSSPDNP